MQSPPSMLRSRSFSAAAPESIPRCLLLLSHRISTPSDVAQLLSRAVTSGLLHPQSLPLFNSILRSLARGRLPSLCLSLYALLRRHGLSPDSYTLTAALSAAASLSDSKLGHQLHSSALKLGLGSDTFVVNSLIHVYSVSGTLGDGRKVFDSASDLVLDVVSWNSMISGYLNCNLCEEALQVFAQMVKDSIQMDAMTPVAALSACARIGAFDMGRRIHGLVIVNGFDIDFYLGSSLVTMYSKCGALEDARKLYDGMPERNVVCWTCMISGYAHLGRFRESVQLFREMQAAGVRPDNATISSVLSSCAQLGALDQGRYVHAYCEINGIGRTLTVNNALIDMYAKCGDIERALQIFVWLVRRDVFSWTAIISGLAMNGNSKEALDLFQDMELESEVMPNEVTFLGVLSACSHGGLVQEGYYYFNRMTQVYKLTPKLEHFGCMVDLLGRAKLLAEAEKFIKQMPIEPDVVIWRSLLFACRVNGNVELAEFAAHKIIEFEPNKCGAHVLLSNVYASASRWTDASRVRRVMSGRSIQKQPGCSSIEINGTLHEFLVADISHHQMEVILGVLLGINRIVLSEPYTRDNSSLFVETKQNKLNLCQR